MNRSIYVLNILVILILSGVHTWTYAADILVAADRGSISLDESFNLVFSSNGKVDDDPDFSPLEKDFELLGTRTSSQISIINGKKTSEKKWIVSLLPKRSGEITIPAISFGRDKSQAIVVTVKQSGDDREKGREIFIEVETSADSVYVQQQLGVTVRVYRSISVANATLSPLTVSGVNTFVEKVTSDDRYRTRIDGRLYDVFQRHYALFPQASGDLTINQLIFKATRGVGRFFADPFGEQPKSIIRRSEEVTVKVKPVPAAFTGDYWLPVQSLDLQADWAPETPEFRVGEPVTLTLKLSARGLPASQLPEIRPEFPESLKIYPDQPVLENRSSGKDLTGTRVEKLAMIPSRPGNFTLPEIRIPYWSVPDETVKVARIPGQAIEVLPALTGNGGGQVLAPEEIFVPEAQPEPAMSPDTDRPESAATTRDQSLALWRGLTIALLIAWLLTLFFWWRSVRQTGHVSGESNQSNPGKLLKQVETACRRDDPRACKQALLDWAMAYWPENPPRNPAEISARLDHRLRREVNELNDALYSPEKAHWDGIRFWQALSAALKAGNKETGKRDATLEPIFRIN